MLAAVILAAGESRRMGRPKATLPYPTGEATPGKVTFLDHLLSLARHPKVGELRIVLGPHAEQIRGRVPLKNEWVVVNPDWQQGQLSSLQAALRSLPASSTDGVLVLLVDQPLISADVVNQLVEAFYSSRPLIVVPTFQNRRGHPVIFSSKLYEELLAAPLDFGARAVVRAHPSDVLEVPVNEEGVVLNLNEPGALRRLSKKE